MTAYMHLLLHSVPCLMSQQSLEHGHMEWQTTVNVERNCTKRKLYLLPFGTVGLTNPPRFLPVMEQLFSFSNDRGHQSPTGQEISLGYPLPEARNIIQNK